MKYAQKFVAFIAAFLLAGSAWGTVFTFFADGVTEGAAQEGRADFDFSADLSTLTLTLTNNVAPTELIASEIDGLRFGLIGPGSATLTGVSGSVVDCTGVASPCPSVAGAPPLLQLGTHRFRRAVRAGLRTVGRHLRPPAVRHRQHELQRNR